jgi:catechol 2,3-dioxygenase-like lactoylglutathione lyase family enzyme
VAQATTSADAAEGVAKKGIPCYKKVAFPYYPITDVARARKFHEETLGLKAGSAGNQGDNWRLEYDLPGGGCLALTNFTKEKPSDSAGGTIAFEVEDLDRLMTDLKGKGVTFRAMSSTVPSAGWRCAWTARATPSCCINSSRSEAHQASRSEGAAFWFAECREISSCTASVPCSAIERRAREVSKLVVEWLRHQSRIRRKPRTLGLPYSHDQFSTLPLDPAPSLATMAIITAE